MYLYRRLGEDFLLGVVMRFTRHHCSNVDEANPDGQKCQQIKVAHVAELADAPDLGSGTVRCEGSSPFVRTTPLFQFCFVPRVVADDHRSCALIADARRPTEEIVCDHRTTHRDAQCNLRTVRAEFASAYHNAATFHL